jgi:hypothetical protein
MRYVASEASAPARSNRSIAIKHHRPSLWDSVLLGCGWSVERTVSQCCEELGRAPVGHEELLRLREGLSALAKLWRLSGRQAEGGA